MAAAAVAESVAAMGSMTREGEVLAWLAADLVLADRLGWPASVPLLATVIVHPALSPGQDRRRARPGEPAWDTVSNLAYTRAAIAAYGSARDTAGRSTRLIAASARSRTHGVEAAIFALLDDDAVAATGLAALPGLGSERSVRRLLERLVAQDGLRELTGRATFRLYGL